MNFKFGLNMTWKLMKVQFNILDIAPVHKAIKKVTISVCALFIGSTNLLISKTKIFEMHSREVNLPFQE